ncbi:MAG TPA: hypothetical protein PKE55_11665 [Kiritimatiellia bacterium]|nr:hypothetical protein [Kiritimatiellia bacterium]
MGMLSSLHCAALSSVGRLCLLWVVFAGSLAHAQTGIREIHAPITITNPGSYKLVRNLSHGVTPIVVAASDVTLDLNGFRVVSSGFFPPYGPAIEQQPGYRNLTVRNGSLLSADSHGLLALGPGTVVESVSIYGCQRSAMTLGDGARVIGCIVMSNTLSQSSAVIRLGEGGRLENTVAMGNQMTTGSVVSVGSYSHVDGVVVHDNHFSGVDGVGLTVGPGSRVERVAIHGQTAVAGSFRGLSTQGGTGQPGTMLAAVSVYSNSAQQTCVGIDAAGPATLRGVLSSYQTSTSANPATGIIVRDNAIVSAALTTHNTGNEGTGLRVEQGARVTASLATHNSHYGFSGINGAWFETCLAVTNGWRGFTLANNNRVQHSLAAGNGFPAPGGQEGGFRTTGNGNVIEYNHSWNNWRGVVVNGANNLVTGNSALQNASGNYILSGGNHVGEVLVQPGPSFSTFNPWINFDL